MTEKYAKLIFYLSLFNDFVSYNKLKGPSIEPILEIEYTIHKNIHMEND